MADALDAPGHARSIGLMTHPLYLLHQTAGAVLIGAMVRRGGPRDAATILTLLVILTAAWVIAMYAEPALRHLLARPFSLSRGLGRGTPPSAFPRAG